MSGGEDGARFGPSLMPGGSEAAWYDTWVKVFRIISEFRIEAVGVQWLSGRVLDSRLRGRGFESHWSNCVVVHEQDTFILT